MINDNDDDVCDYNDDDLKGGGTTLVLNVEKYASALFWISG